ncbi:MULTISPECIES: hypothetical protein [Sorangium]|uniref:hypothetical protein n=1 Tax=Sorangium TaxID=39643 RepID=UPI003D9C5B5C
MRIPLRLNRAGWPSLGLPRRICFPDPRDLLRPEQIAAPEVFSERVSILLLSGTRKTTRPGRHRQSDALLVKALGQQRPVVLDVGASDGSTALDLLTTLGDAFASYFVTDRALSLRVRTDDRGRAFFYDADGACVLAATPRLLFYPAAEGLRWLPRWASPWLQGGIPPYDPAYPEVSLVQPRLQELARRDARVVLRTHDIFQPWDGPAPTVIKAANLLNRAYFSDDQLRQAMRNFWSALAPDGLLLVIDNRDIEKASLFARTEGGFRHIDSIHGGTEIRPLALSC